MKIKTTKKKIYEEKSKIFNVAFSYFSKRMLSSFTMPFFSKEKDF